MDLTLSRQIQHTCALVSLLFQTLNHLAQPREFIGKIGAVGKFYHIPIRVFDRYNGLLREIKTSDALKHPFFLQCRQQIEHLG